MEVGDAVIVAVGAGAVLLIGGGGGGGDAFLWQPAAKNKAAMLATRVRDLRYANLVDEGTRDDEL
jgi:hypothetical protein